MNRSYSVNGKAHRIMRHLADEPRLLADVWRTMGAFHDGVMRRKIFYVVAGMEDEGFVEQIVGGKWRLTLCGSRALAHLDSGRPIETGPRQAPRNAA